MNKHTCETLVLLFEPFSNRHSLSHSRPTDISHQLHIQFSMWRLNMHSWCIKWTKYAGEWHVWVVGCIRNQRFMRWHPPRVIPHTARPCNLSKKVDRSVRSVRRIHKNNNIAWWEKGWNLRMNGHNIDPRTNQWIDSLRHSALYPTFRQVAHSLRM